VPIAISYALYLRNDPELILTQPAKYLSHAPNAAPENLFLFFRNACPFIPFDSMAPVCLGTLSMTNLARFRNLRAIESRRRIKEFQIFAYCSADE